VRAAIGIGQQQQRALGAQPLEQRVETLVEDPVVLHRRDHALE
jgi:hypothetical protein